VYLNSEEAEGSQDYSSCDEHYNEGDFYKTTQFNLIEHYKRLDQLVLARNKLLLKTDNTNKKNAYPKWE